MEKSSKFRNRVLLTMYVTGILFSSEANAQTDYLRSIGEGRIEHAHKGQILTLKHSPDGKRLATVSNEDPHGIGSIIKLWDLKTGSKIWEMATDDETINRDVNPASDVWMLRFSSNGNTLTSRDVEGVVNRWNAKTGKNLSRRQLAWHSVWPGAASFNSSGSMFAFSDLEPGDGRIVLYRPKVAFDIEPLLNGEVVLEQSNILAGHTERVWGVALSPDSKTLFSGDMDGNLKLWNIESRENIASWKGNESQVFSVAFSPDGKLLASASAENNIKLWDAKNGKHVYTIVTGGLHGHTNWPCCIVFHPDGKSIASAGMEGIIKFWRVPEGLVK